MVEGACTDPNAGSRQLEYEYLAHQINREDILVNNRMTWVLQLNGFLLAALALAGKDLPAVYQHYFTFALPAIALTTTFAGLVGVRAAQRQLSYLKGLWSEERFPGWPRPFGDPDAFRHGTYPAYLPLWALLISWIAFLIYALLAK